MKKIIPLLLIIGTLILTGCTQEDELLFQEEVLFPTEMEQVKYTFNNTKGEYIWADIEEDTYNWTVYKVSEESLEEKVAGLGEMTGYERITDVGIIKENAELIIHNFASEKQKSGNLIHEYIPPLFLSCFDEREFWGDDITYNSKTYDLPSDINKEGLVLDCNNISAERVMSGNNYYFSIFNRFAVVVKADVTCIEKSKTYEEYEWIPDEGETEEVTFVVDLGAATGGMTQIFIYNIGVL